MDPMFNSTEVVHSTVHHITTTGLPVFSGPRRLAPDRLRKAKAEFDHMLQLGLIRTSKSPLHLVRKSEADFRLVGDYRRLNSVPDRYSIPNIQDFQRIYMVALHFLKLTPFGHMTLLIFRKLQ